MPLLLVGTRELAGTDVTAEGLLARVCADVCGEVVGAREGPHAYPTLEGFLSCVDADVSRQLVRSGKPTVTVLYGAGVGSLVHRRFAGAVGVLAWLDGDQLEGQLCGLVHLRQDLMTLTGGLVVLCQGGGLVVHGFLFGDHHARGPRHGFRHAPNAEHLREL